jgi:NADPH2:quinone reductase
MSSAGAPLPARMQAVQLATTGGPDVLQSVELPTPTPGEGEVLVRAHAIGVGMPDVLVRTGRYPWMPPLPAIPGIEMSGHIAAVGPDVTGFEPGDPVFVSARELPVRGGCYAQYRTAPARAVYRLPEGIDLDAAACLSNYQVAWHLLHSATNGMRYETILLWAAAGGVGSAVIQLARRAGKRVIGLAGGAAKCDFVRELGAHVCIDYKADDVLAAVKSATGGRGVDLVLDPVGGPHLHRNFDYLAPLGLVVNFGLLEGKPDLSRAQNMVDRLGDSLALRLFSMHVFDKDPPRRRAAMQELVPLLAQGRIRPPIHSKLPLAQARRAHELLDGGTVVGKLLLVP